MIRFGLHVFGFDSLRKTPEGFGFDSNSDLDLDYLDSIRFGSIRFGFGLDSVRIRFGFGLDLVQILNLVWILGSDFGFKSIRFNWNSFELAWFEWFEGFDLE